MLFVNFISVDFYPSWHLFLTYHDVLQTLPWKREAFFGLEIKLEKKKKSFLRVNGKDLGKVHHCAFLITIHFSVTLSMLISFPSFLFLVLVECLSLSLCESQTATYLKPYFFHSVCERFLLMDWAFYPLQAQCSLFCGETNKNITN